MTLNTLLLLATTWACLVGMVAFSLWSGGAPEKIAGAAFAMGVLLSWLSYPHGGLGYREFETALAAVDIGFFVILIFLTLYAKRLWPIAATAAQLVTCLAHVMKLLDPAMSAGTYSQMEAFSTWPVMLAIGGGTYLHLRRTARNGVERSWNRSLPVAARSILRRLRLD